MGNAGVLFPVREAHRVLEHSAFGEIRGGSSLGRHRLFERRPGRPQVSDLGNCQYRVIERRAWQVSSFERRLTPSMSEIEPSGRDVAELPGEGAYEACDPEIDLLALS